MVEVITYSKKLKPYARALRKEMTKFEQILWQKIRKKQISGVQFYRQKIIGTFILDFYSNVPKLAIELDGDQHSLAANKDKDCNRDKYLNALGIYVLRFNNFEIANHLKDALIMIEKTINKLKK